MDIVSIGNRVNYLINEIFPCVQGEGIHSGLPSIIIRTQICNLRCSWCDTPYTHTYKSDLDSNNQPKHKKISIEELAVEVNKHPQIHNLILTGGEPTLQNLKPIADFFPSHSLEVESNGTQIPHEKFPSFTEEDYSRFHWNISPKFSNASVDLDNQGLTHWSQLSHKPSINISFKFVVRESKQHEDLAEIAKIIKEFQIPSSKVLLMPEGVCQDSQMNNAWLVEYCIQHGYRYSARMHILNYKNKRKT